MTRDPVWDVVDAQLREFKSVKSGAEVIALTDNAGQGCGDGFFMGTGEDMWDALDDAGWRTVWSKANYHWKMRAPDGSTISYVEGDLYLNASD